MRVVVTGVAGFLGGHVADRLVFEGHQVAGIDNMLGGDFKNVPFGLDELVFEDCRNLDVMKALTSGADAIVHCAAAAHEGLSVFSPCLITEHTYNTTVAVAAAAAANHVKRVVFTSTAARYGAQPVMPFTEDMTPAPVDPYGIAKVAAEQVLRCMGLAHGFEVVIAVPHNIIGPYQKYDDPFRNVASIMANLMLQNRPPIIYGDGQQTRSFSFIQDCVNPLIKMVTMPGLDGEVINIGPDDPPITILELACRLREIIGYEGGFQFVPDRPMEVKHTWVSADKARRMLGYEAHTSLESGLKQLVDWIRAAGPKPFKYHLPIEIDSPKLPVTWRDRRF